ncbi:tryptophan dimethylallyltransferase family protein [Actinokineospora iranica]|uniref:tryptophan dimethylallyltransferase family protein n=1 Tax=Actinokineospora iranica TaxID=1271860 RepID=UPI001E5018EF|nr:tryptophan dimethylallyltransferase family protein [Actinokineospora iranica]
MGDRAEEVCDLVADLLGPAAVRSVDEPPLWRSDVADDHTPIEYSVAFEEDGSHTLRLLIECVAAKPSPRANQLAALAALDRLAARYPVTLDRFDAVRDLFLPDEPRGIFSLWFSIVVRRDDPPRVKIYFNPEVRGKAKANTLVAAALDRLGFAGSYAWLREHTPRPESTLDRYSFFALDLDDTPRSRVKVYQSHYRATLRDAQHAAGAGRSVDTRRLAEFGTLIGGGDGPFDGRPLVSAFTFLSGDSAQPSGYSLYVPVRDYVRDDAVTMQRVRLLVERYGLDRDALERSVTAVTDRPLEEGVGLIAHVSLRIGPPRPGVTVYLSAEAYGVARPSGAHTGAA